MAVDLEVVKRINKVNELILNPLIVLLFTVAAITFFVGIFRMIANSDNEEERDKGRKNILYGIIGMSIMIGVYGIVRFILATFQIDGTGTIFFRG